MTKNNNNKKKKKKKKKKHIKEIMRSPRFEPRIYRLKDHNGIHYTTEANEINR